MRSHPLLGVVVTTSLLCACTANDPDPDLPRPEPTLSQAVQVAPGVNEAGYAIFQAAAQDEGNLVFSPLSIGTAFAMLGPGASGDVAEGLSEFLGFPVADPGTWAAFNSLELLVEAESSGRTEPDSQLPHIVREEPVVQIANALFVDEAFAPVPQYADNAARWYGAGVRTTPFAANPARARGDINGWVSDRTHKLIPQLLTEPPSPAVQAILVNTLYLKASWEYAFHDFDTPSPFYLLDGSTSEAMMLARADMPLEAVEGENYQAVALPYWESDLEMLLIVPASGAYLDVEGRFGVDFVAEVDAALRPMEVIVRMPAFEATTTFDLREILQTRLGYEGIFDTPGLDGIGPGLQVTGAVHSARIEVTEAGTEAAAATAVEVAGSAPPEEQIEIIADRPYLYVIRDGDTGAVLFIGRVLDPAAG